MPKIFTRLAIVLFLFGSISLANAQSQQSTVSAGSGWTFVQDSIATDCTVPHSSCTFVPGNLITTTAGSVWIVSLNDASGGPTISSVSGGGGTWVRCTSCFVSNSTVGHQIDVWYSLNGAAGTTTGITANFSGTISSGPLALLFTEILPPPGTTASFDTAATAFTASRCTNCSGAPVNLAATDGVVQITAGFTAVGWNSCSSPYVMDYASNCVGLNISGSVGAPTVTSLADGDFMVSAIAFKSSAGTFAPPATPISVVSFTDPNSGGISCSPSCTVTIPTTKAGDLLYVQAANLGSHIQSVSGGASSGNSWVVPSACAISEQVAGNDNLSCAYLLSVAANTTQITVTMSGSVATILAVAEVSSGGTGNFVLDAIGSITNPASLTPGGVALTLNGSNDVIFQGFFEPGGSSAMSLYPMPYVAHCGNEFYCAQASMGILVNTRNGAKPFNTNNQNNATIATAVAFAASGGTTSLPNPPTGLVVAVQ